MPLSDEDRGRGGRKRRTAEEARREILDAAERRLRESGPDGIRLQEIARDVGISHPTILHHFESRDGLIEALQVRAIERLEARIVEVLTSAQAVGDTAAVEFIEDIFEALGDSGLARLLAWRALSSDGPDERDQEDQSLRHLTDLVHSRRLIYSEGLVDNAKSREDSEFIVRLTAAATLGDGIFAPVLDAMTGHGDDPEVRRRFRAWYARMILEHIDRGS